jgi:hypothetical protein
MGPSSFLCLSLCRVPDEATWAVAIRSSSLSVFWEYGFHLVSNPNPNWIGVAGMSISAVWMAAHMWCPDSLAKLSNTGCIHWPWLSKSFCNTCTSMDLKSPSLLD